MILIVRVVLFMVSENTTQDKMKNAQALFEQGRAYENGNGCEKDLRRAAELYVEAAKCGNIQACILFYFDMDLKNHLHVSRDRFEVILNAAKLGWTAAQFSIGARFRSGLDCKKDYEAAFYWFEKASKNGHAEATYYLGAMYRRGRAVDVDEGLADLLTRAAADMGCAPAMHMIGKKALSGDKPTAEAIKWMVLAAKKGYRAAIYDLANIYLDGSYVEADALMGLEYLKRAAGMELASAAYQLGTIYENGLYGIDKNPTEAMRWYNKAANLDYVGAKLRLAEIYEAGVIVDRNLKKSLRYYHEVDRYGWHYVRERINYIRTDLSRIPVTG